MIFRVETHAPYEGWASQNELRTVGAVADWLYELDQDLDAHPAIGELLHAVRSMRAGQSVQLDCDLTVNLNGLRVTALSGPTRLFTYES